MMTRVAVLVPTISTGPWLDASITSLLDQTHDNFEIVVVHDGVQPDKSAGWLRDPRVHVIVLPERGGLPRALNIGAAATDAPYLARLDSDDIAYRRRLELQSQFLDDNDQTVVVGTAAEYIDSHGQVIGQSVHGEGHVDASLSRKNRLIHPTVMFRRGAFMALGGYDESLSQMEDYDLWLRMAATGRVSLINSCLIGYRLHRGQMSRRSSPYAAYVRRILRRRRQLARCNDTSTALQAVYDLAWWTAQLLRYHGFRKAAHDRH